MHRLNIIGKPGKKVVAVAAIAVLLLIAAAVIVTVQMNRKDSAEEAVRADNAKFKAAVEESDYYYAQRAYQSAVKPLERYQKSGLSEANKTVAYLKIAAVYEGQKDYKKALQMYREAEKNGLLNKAGVLYGIARTEGSLGNNQEAAKYYRKLAEFAKNNKDQFTQDDITHYEQAVKHYEGLQ